MSTMKYHFRAFSSSNAVSLDDDDYGAYDDGSGDDSLEKIADAEVSDVEDDETISDDDSLKSYKNKTTSKMDDIAFEDNDDDDEEDVDDDDEDDFDENEEDNEVNEEVCLFINQFISSIGCGPRKARETPSALNESLCSKPMRSYTKKQMLQIITVGFGGNWRGKLFKF